MTHKPLWAQTTGTIRLLALIALAVSTLGTARPAHALSIVVASNADGSLAALDANTTCDLREAIVNANDGDDTWTDCSTGSSGLDKITFAADYTITLVNAQLPTITSAVTIVGQGRTHTFIRADAAPGIATYRVFEVASAGNLSLESLSVANGRCFGSCNTVSDHGGGILSAGTLSLLDSSVTGSRANAGGGLYNNGGVAVITSTIFSDDQAYDGAAILNAGSSTLYVLESSLSGNWSHSAGVGAGIYNNGALVVKGSTFASNKADSGSGSGVYNYNGGTATITNSTITGSSNAGGVANQTPGATTTLTIRNSTIANNNGSGVVNTSGATLNMANTIASGNTTNDCLNSGYMGTNVRNLIVNNSGCGTPAVSTDPMLGALTKNGGLTETMLPLPGSPVIDAGDNATCAADPVSGYDQRQHTRPMDSDGNGTATCEIGAVENDGKLVFRSVGSQDGWILEATESSGTGGSSEAVDAQFNVGDEVADKQYRAILSFNTGPSLPDTAVVTSATLKLKKTGVVGGSNPFSSLGDLSVDIRSGGFSGNAALELTDFSAAGSKNYVAKYTGAPTTWNSAIVNAIGYPYVNRTGGTQFRLRFATDDNDNNVANYIRFASGNAITTSRPQLVITYYVP